MGSKYDNIPILDEHGNLIHRMTPEERAKIFLPFDALKGLRKALREVEDELESAGGPQLANDPFEKSEF